MQKSITLPVTMMEAAALYSALTDTRDYLKKLPTSTMILGEIGLLDSLVEKTLRECKAAGWDLTLIAR